MGKKENKAQGSSKTDFALSRRNILLSSGSLLALTATTGTTAEAQTTKPAAPAAAAGGGGKPNILVIFGDDIGTWNGSPGTPRWRIAQECGISPAALSRLTCSAVGQAFLEGLTATEMRGEVPPPPPLEVIPPPPPLFDEPIPVADSNRPVDWYPTLLPSKDGG